MQSATPAYYVISTDESVLGDAFTNKAFAEQQFKRIAATGRFVRLVAIEGNERVELDRKNDLRR